MSAFKQDKGPGRFAAFYGGLLEQDWNIIEARALAYVEAGGYDRPMNTIPPLPADFEFKLRTYADMARVEYERHDKHRYLENFARDATEARWRRGLAMNAARRGADWKWREFGVRVRD